VGADPETRVRFAQAEPSSVLCLLFIATQELDEESDELFGGAPETLVREKWTQKWSLPTRA
jgi:hypothetical protein